MNDGVVYINALLLHGLFVGVRVCVRVCVSAELCRFTGGNTVFLAHTLTLLLLALCVCVCVCVRVFY